MKKAILVFIASIAFLLPGAQDIAGEWNGMLKLQGLQLRLVFNFSKNPNGYTATMDSPDQHAKGIPVTSITFDSNQVKLTVSNAGIEYLGTLNEQHIIEGTFRQAGQSFPLNLSKEKIEKQILWRPQEPKPPFPYYSEDIQFDNTKDNIVLSGTLTLPQKAGHYPVAILISGSGPQNRDEELFGHKPFLLLADKLTRSGIAVLRFDDRGTARSTGNFKMATTLDFVSDVEAAIHYLQTRKEINQRQIGLIGHSEGGIIAPIVAVNSGKINFIVLLAGTGIAGGDILLQQQELIGRASGANEAALQKTRAINEGAFKIVSEYAGTPRLEKALTEYVTQTLKDDPASARPAGVKEADFIIGQVSQLTSPWMQFFIKYDPAATLEKVKCPVLALNGEKDLQVPAAINLAAIKKALEKGGNKRVTTKLLPGLNHLFQQCTTGAPAEYATIDQTMAPAALDEITAWILQQVGAKN